ncbi:MAG: Dabb family protein [Myxococcales bacterium]|nr:Dabb family protein [Myxococcales bacterium]
MAIARHVYIRLKSEHQSEAGRAALAQASKALSDIAGVDSFALLRPADQHAHDAWDACLVLRFADLDAVGRYREHPDHRGYVDGFLHEHAAVIKAWNFEL